MPINSLSQATRAHFSTLLDALTFQPSSDQRDAVIFVQTSKEPVRVSRRQFHDAVRKYAQGLTALGIEPRDIIVIAHTQNLESIFVFWGALMIGAIPSMFPTMTEKLNPQIYMSNMADLVKLSAVRAVFTTDDFAPQLALNVTCPVYSTGRLAKAVGDGQEMVVQSFALDPDQTAFLQHSSGTTGLQKGVALSHRAVLNQLAHYGDAIGLNADDVAVSWLPLYHDMGLVAGFLLPLVQGIPLVLMSPFDWVRHPALLLRAIHEHQGTLCWQPNFAYNHCARRIRKRDGMGYSAASMRLFINCSEPAYHDSHKLFLQRFAAIGVTPEMLSVSYAMAENTFAVTQTVPGERATLDSIDRHALEEKNVAEPVQANHPDSIVKVSCGKPILGTNIRVVNDQFKDQPERHVGEIAIQSDCMLTEYYNRPDLLPFHDGWFFTGDRGYIADGEVYIIGRSKDLIINAGKNVYPQDIEAIVNKVPGIHVGRAVVFGVSDSKEGTELIAVVAEVATEDPAERQIIGKRIRQEVSRQSTVSASYVRLVGPNWLIKTSSGKLARNANHAKWLAEEEMIGS